MKGGKMKVVKRLHVTFELTDYDDWWMKVEGKPEAVGVGRTIQEAFNDFVDHEVDKAIKQYAGAIKRAEHD